MFKNNPYVAPEVNIKVTSETAKAISQAVLEGMGGQVAERVKAIAKAIADIKDQEGLAAYLVAIAARGINKRTTGDSLFKDGSKYSKIASEIHQALAKDGNLGLIQLTADQFARKNDFPCFYQRKFGISSNLGLKADKYVKASEFADYELALTCHYNAMKTKTDIPKIIAGNTVDAYLASKAVKMGPVTGPAWTEYLKKNGHTF